MSYMIELNYSQNK